VSDPDVRSSRGELAAHIQETHRGLDTVDMCRMRLVSLRTRIETNWPQATGRFIRRESMTPQLQTTISDLLAALPSPLPLSTGADPECIYNETDTDLCMVAGRAVDAGLTLLDGASMETVYNGRITMLESYHPDAVEPIVVPYPTVGLLVSTIIGTLEAISELILEPEPGKLPTPTLKAKAKEPPKIAVKAASNSQQPPPMPEAPAQRGPRAPRI
jgi:hypothetical protein